MHVAFRDKHKKRRAGNLQSVSCFVAVLVQSKGETQAEVFGADKQQHLKGMFPSLAGFGSLELGTQSWAGATSKLDVVPLRSREQES